MYLASFAVYDSDIFSIFCQPLADINAKFSDEFYAWWVVVIERKPLDTTTKPRWIVRSLWTPRSKHIIVNWMLQINVYRSSVAMWPIFGHVANFWPWGQNCYITLEQEAQLRHRNSTSAAHVYLRWLTDCALWFKKCWPKTHFVIK